jgi:hypothetical protein
MSEAGLSALSSSIHLGHGRFKLASKKWQGCPLSPLLFILVMEGLSLLLKNGHTEGKLSGVKVSRIVKILHILFVDDVLIMTNNSIQ